MRLQTAKAIPMTELLARLGCEPVGTSAGGRQVWYRSPFRQESKASFNVNVQKNIWHDLGTGQGGTVVDFVMEYFRLTSVSDALRKLDGLGSWQTREAALPLFDPLASPSRASTGTGTPVNDLQNVVVKPITDRRLIHYLNERGIALDTARPYVQEIRYTRNGKDYFSLAFPHMAREGKPQGYELRNKYFQAAWPGKDISLILPEGTANTRTVAVFEGFFDMLSWLTWLGKFTAPFPALVLNSVALKATAMETLRQMGAERVECYLDRDTSGQKITAELQAGLAGMEVVNRSGVFEGYKDFNEFLVGQLQLSRQF